MFGFDVFDMYREYASISNIYSNAMFTPPRSMVIKNKVRRARQLRNKRGNRK